jgi:hypothetical protein
VRARGNKELVLHGCVFAWLCAYMQTSCKHHANIMQASCKHMRTRTHARARGSYLLEVRDAHAYTACQR